MQERDDAGTEEVPRQQWAAFLNDFSEFNAETGARVEQIERDTGAVGILCEDKPLLDITYDGEAGPAQVIVECGDTGGSSPAAFRHIIWEPTSIRARKIDVVGWDAVQIVGRDGTVVVTANPHPGRGSSSFEDAGRSETRAG